MTEDEKERGRLLQVYFDAAAEILQNEVGPVTIYPRHGFRFMGDMIVVHRCFQREIEVCTLVDEMIDAVYHAD